MTAARTEPGVVAVDLGGTKLMVADVDPHGRIIDFVRRPTAPMRGPDAVVGEIAAAFEELRGRRGGTTYAALGIGVAGQVHPETGVVRLAPNLGWHDYPLRARLEERLALPVIVLNDVQAAAYGEAQVGAGRGEQEMIALFVGTGVGGGVVHGGSLVLGCGGSAGEVGHITIDLDGPECRCGNHGCLEAFAGGWAIARRARELVGQRPAEAHALLSLVDEDAAKLTAEAVAAAAIAGDPLARELVAEVAGYVGVGIATMANLYNPCMLVLGGGVIEGIPDLIDAIARIVQQRALAAAAQQLRIVPAALAGNAGVVGAAAWARHRLRHESGLPSR